MGLDMYLNEKHYVGNYYRKEHEKLKILKNGETFGNPIDEESITYIVCRVGQWRKANAIHAWFVRELADGVDDCREVYAPREKLLELKELCVKVKENLDLAPTLLPTQEGFFFGTQEYDDWYVEDLDLTINIIDKTNDKGNYYYEASW